LGVCKLYLGEKESGFGPGFDAKTEMFLDSKPDNHKDELSSDSPVSNYGEPHKDESNDRPEDETFVGSFVVLSKSGFVSFANGLLEKSSSSHSNSGEHKVDNNAWDGPFQL
jgi:hypothetical protein